MLMPRLAPNLSMMFTELPFPRRFEAAARAGFQGVEYLFPYPYAPGEIRRQLDLNGLEQVLFNMPPGDWSAGERGLAAMTGRESEFERSIEDVLRYAPALGCTRVHCMAGIAEPTVRNEQTYKANLRKACRALRPYGIDVLIEPINTRDMPGYFLHDTRRARAVIEELAEPNLRLQFDCYHCQIMEGDLTTHLIELKHLIGHVQIAGVPGRNEPDTGEVNYRHIFRVLDRLGYEGWVGCEYNPESGTEQGLGWIREW